MIAPVYDVTAPGVEQYTMGPGKVAAHAYPPNSRIALCGHVRSEHPPSGRGKQCPTCLEQAGRKDWTGR